MPNIRFAHGGIVRRSVTTAFAAMLMLAALVMTATSPALAADGDESAAAATGPSIAIDKTTNGQDADAPPGPTIAAGDPVTWTYVVTNDGDTALVDILVTDDANDGAVISCTGQDNGSISLAPGGSIECASSSSSWFSGAHAQHANTATATGTPEGTSATVVDTDDSHYRPVLSCPYGERPGRIIVDIFDNTPDGGGMLGNGLDPDTLGPISADIPAGEYTVRWASYDAHDFKGETNPGQTEEIWNIAIGGATSDPTSDIPWNEDFASGTMASTLTVASAADGITVHHPGTVGEINSVYAICVALDPLVPSVDITKSTEDSVVPNGEAATFTITVTNDGDVPLTDVSVSDPLTPACDFSTGDTTTVPGGTFDGSLDVGETFSYECTTDALSEGFVNVATVTGTPPTGAPVTDDDDEPVDVPDDPAGAIAIDKLVGPEGTPAGDPAFVDLYTRGSSVDAVTWEITITNERDYRLGDLSFTDALTPSCETAFAAAVQSDDDGPYLGPGETLRFTCDDVLGAGVAKQNVASVGAVDPWGQAVPTVEDDASTQSVAASGTIGDTVWSDENANGIQDAGEKGIAGATVNLTRPDGTVIQTTTNSNGNYLFSALPEGTYQVALVLSSIPDPQDGSLKLTTAGSFTVSLADGESYLDADFGVVAVLPNTGMSSDGFAAAGLTFLLVGTVALVATRQAHHDDGDTTTG